MAKAKVPKKVAGVKIPKALRSSDLVEGFIQNDTLRKILADALIAAAGAAAAVLTRKIAPSTEQVANAGDKAMKTGAKAASVTADLATGLTDTVAEVVAGAANSLLAQEPVSDKKKKRSPSKDQDARA